MRRTHASALTRRASGCGDAAQVERHEQRFAVRPWHRHVQDVWGALRTAPVNDRVGDALENSRLQSLAQLSNARAMCLALGKRQLRGASETNRGGDVLRAGPPP